VCLALAACEVQKSETPLSPSIAGPLPGVTITAPQPTEPPSGAEVLTTSLPLRLVFTNATSDSPRPFWHIVEIAADQGFNTVLYRSERLNPDPSGRTTHSVPGKLAKDATYYWRVRAEDGANSSAPSNVAFFAVIEAVVIETPVPISPVGGETAASTSPDFIVGNAPVTGPAGFVAYRVQVARDQAFTQVVANVGAARSGGDTTTINVGPLAGDTLYYWRTWGGNGTVTSAMSAVQSFRTPAGATGGGGGGGGGGRSGQNPADELDLGQVTWLHRNVSTWAVTSTVTNVSVTRDTVCVDHTKAGNLPTSGFGDIEVEGNVWIFANINGRWYGATWDWLRVGQTCKSITADEFGRDQIRISPMDASWAPRAGDTIGFMISTRARDSVEAGEERTNVVLVTWPY